MELLETKKQEALWITPKEAMAIFGKSKTALMYALYRANIWGRQCIFGSTWFVEYWSCVNYWGKPVDIESHKVIVEEYINHEPK